MADNDRALVKAQKEAESALVLADKLKKDLREARQLAGPIGLKRKAIAAGSGVVLAVAEAGKMGEFMGRDITAAHLIPAVDYLVEKVTDGKPPGGVAGDLVRVLSQAGDVQTANGAKRLTEQAIGLARVWLTMNRASSPQPAAHPTPKDDTIDGTAEKA